MVARLVQGLQFWGEGIFGLCSLASCKAYMQAGLGNRVAKHLAALSVRELFSSFMTGLNLGSASIFLILGFQQGQDEKC